MAKDLNKVMIIGRLGADPEMRFTPNGSAVTTFNVASGRSWKTESGEQREETEWFPIVAWNKLAEICNQYLTKGSRVYIEGRLQTRTWDDDSGQKHYKTEVVAGDMIILDTRKDSPSYDDNEPPARPAAPTAAPTRGNAQNKPSQPARRPVVMSDDDLPF